MLAAALPIAPAGAATYPTGFEERTIVSGLTAPVGVAWTPDGRMLVIEKAGRLKVVNPGATTATTILDLSSRVNSYWDRGLLGIAVDTSFASNRFIYLLHTQELQPLTPDGSGVASSRLSRFELSASNQVTNETILLGTYTGGACPAPSNTVDCIPSEGASHSIGSVRSAPDGTLYVGSGDASSFSFVDSLALRTYDERSMAGKILHVDRNGRGLPGHPFCPSNADLGQVCTKLHAKGFRNPYRFKLRPGGGLTVADVGWSTREEVNLMSAGGRSYGWPCYEGTARTPGYSDLAECGTEYAKEGTSSADVGPSYDYAHRGSSAVMAGPTYLGAEYPLGYRDTIFFGDYAAGFLSRLRIGSNGAVAGVEPFATGWSATDIEAAPNGDIVFVSFGDGSPGTGSVKRIVYSPGNGSPTANASATPTSGDAPLAVQFSSAGSTDPDGDTLSYRWVFGDGSTSTSANPSHTYTTSGTRTATLTVDDGRGRTNSDTVQISVGGSTPAPQSIDRVEVNWEAAYASAYRIQTSTDGASFTTAASVTRSAAGLAVTSFPARDARYVRLAADARATIYGISFWDFRVFAPTAPPPDSDPPETTIASGPSGTVSSTSASFAFGSDEEGSSFACRLDGGAWAACSSPKAYSSLAAGPHTFEVRATDPAGNTDPTPATRSWTIATTATYAETVAATPGLRHWWRLGDATTTAADSKGTNAGVYLGGSPRVAGLIANDLDGAHDFDGLNDAVDLAPGLFGAPTRFSVEAWVRIDTKKPTGGFHFLVTDSSNDLTTDGFSLVVNANNKPRLFVGQSSTIRASAVSSQALALGTTYHLVGTYDGQRARVYVNGVERASVAYTGGIGWLASRDLMLGRQRKSNGLSTRWLDGQLDEVALYDVALDAATVLGHHQRGR